MHSNRSNKGKPLITKRSDRYDRDNLEQARAILTNPERHGGNESCAVQWARLVIARLGPTTNVVVGKNGSPGDW